MHSTRMQGERANDSEDFVLVSRLSDLDEHAVRDGEQEVHSLADYA